MSKPYANSFSHIIEIKLISFCNSNFQILDFFPNGQNFNFSKESKTIVTLIGLHFIFSKLHKRKIGTLFKSNEKQF